jgi:ribonuclease-3
VVAEGPGTDFKSRLQEVVARRFDDLPDYVIQETGPDHDKWFEASVHVGADRLGEGAGRSKKAAEQAAAAQAWTALGEGSELADPDDRASENGAENA